MSYGLALSGGGARGAAHAGVLLALKEAQQLPGCIGGTSAGSIVAGLFAAGMEPEELCELVRNLSIHGQEYLDLNLFSLLRLIPQALSGRHVSACGLLKGKRLRALFRTLTKETHLEQLSVPLLIPAVDLRSGTTVCFTNFSAFPGFPPVSKLSHSFGQQVLWQERGPLADIMMASSSVPGIFCPVCMDSFCLVDGGVTNNLPVNLMLSAGVKSVAAVDIGSPYRMPEGESIFEILSHSFSIMSANLKDCRSMGETVLLTPPLPEEAGLFSFEQMEACMETAYTYTKKQIRRFDSFT